MKKILLILALLVPRLAAAQVIPPSQTISVVDSGTQCSVAGACAQWQLPNGAPSFTVQVTGTLTTVTLTFRGSADGNTFFDILATKVSTGVQAATTTTTGQYAFTNPGIVALRVVGTVVTSGAANLTLTRGSASSSSRAFPSFGSFATGDLLYASAANVISGLADVAAGSYLRSGGVGVAPLWSTLVLPNAATTGDLLMATSANTVGVRAAVAVGQVLASAGTSTAPAYSGNPLLTAGTGTQTYHTGGVLFSESISTSTAADNNYVKSSTYSIPSNTLINNGDMLEVDMVYLQSSEATDSRAYLCNYGFTSWTGNTVGFTGGINLASHSTASASVNIHSRIYIKRVSSTSFNYWAESLVGTSYQNDVWTNSTALTITDAQNIACEARNTDGTPVASAITLKEFQVRYVPYF
jgi:hypothetical protein